MLLPAGTGIITGVDADPGSVVTALHVFDMDGTLLRASTAALEISRRLDRVTEMTGLEGRYATGEIGEHDFAVAVRELWRDLTPELVSEVVDAAPWMAGIDEVCADIAARGETSMLITMSPDFFARHLHRRGIDIVHGSRFPAPPFTRAALETARQLLPADKVRHTEDVRVRLGLAPAACVAYGDSHSDAPLFAHLPHTVAVNGDAAIEGAARVVYRGDDLREAYAHGRALLGRDEPDT